MEILNNKILGQILIISALVLSFCSLPVMAQDNQCGCKPEPDHYKMHCKMHEKFDDLLTQAGVTPDQKQKIDAIWQQSRTQAEPIKTCLHEKMKALFDYISCPQANKDQALAQAKAISDLKLQLETIRINAMFQAKCILTSDQQQKLSQLIKEKMQKYEKRCPHDMSPME